MPALPCPALPARPPASLPARQPGRQPAALLPRPRCISSVVGHSTGSTTGSTDAPPHCWAGICPAAGPAVFERELIWLRSASGEWVPVPATLDNGES
jgi:hypothetical protein